MSLKERDETMEVCVPSHIHTHTFSVGVHKHTFFERVELWRCMAGKIQGGEDA